MDDERYEEVMDAWTARECRTAPDLRPTEEMRRMVEARRRRGRILGPPGIQRWLRLGAAAACLMACAWILRLAMDAGTEPTGLPGGSHVASRTWRPPKGGLRVEGPAPGSPAGRGPKKGGLPFTDLLLQVHRGGSAILSGVDLRFPSDEEVSIEPADDYRLFLRPSRELHVHVYQVSGDGGLARLFPGEPPAIDPNPLPAGALRAVPAEPEWFHLERRAGEERLVVVASPRPLGELGARWEERRLAQDPRRREELAGRVLERIESLREATDAGAVVVEFALNRR